MHLRSEDFAFMYSMLPLSKLNVFVLQISVYLDNASSSTEPKDESVMLQVVFAIVIIAAMLATVLLIFIFVLAT
jgi:hypothetical protein